MASTTTSCGSGLTKSDTIVNEQRRSSSDAKKKLGAVARWWLARKAKKIAAENAQRVRDEERMEELLGKIAATGMGSLTDEERRFLERFSARYRRE